MTMMYVPTTSDHVAALATIVDATLFPGEMLPDQIAPFFAGEGTEFWITAVRDGEPVGVSFTRAEDLADAVWNMKALAVAPALHRGGIGRSLVTATEASVREREGRLLILDTSSDASQIPAVAFYQSVGYRFEGIVRDFWAEGQDRITMAKRL